MFAHPADIGLQVSIDAVHDEVCVTGHGFEPQFVKTLAENRHATRIGIEAA